MPKRHRPGKSATRVLAHVEEVVLASSGEDAFELVYALAAARILGPKARRRHPTLGIASLETIDPSLVRRVDELLGRALEAASGAAPVHGALDAVFEALVSRVSKGQKGQFFTPRHVVDFVLDVLALRRGEVVVDPACGSGAFLAHARVRADVGAWGCDVDARAVRVARLLALAGGGDEDAVLRDDGLRTTKLPVADVVATNPPFAGRADASGFDVEGVVATPERDVLFLERSLALLRPGGRLGIVLPYGKAGGHAFARLRRWLIERARVTLVVGLPRETFMPHTAQRCFVLFAEKRAPGARPDPNEETRFTLSERAGKDAAGEPTEEPHDLDSVLSGHSKSVVRRLADLGDEVVLAPERHLVDRGDGTPLGELVVLRNERFDPKAASAAPIVVDTTHARDGLLDVAAAARVTETSPARSAKKRALPGDVIVSRLRPYLRQIALVTAEVGVSTEFYVLAPRRSSDDLAWLLPFLLSDPVQERLAASQEGGHHPRVPTTSLLGIAVPVDVLRTRSKTSTAVRGALERLYAAQEAYRGTLARRPRARGRRARP